MKELIDFQIPYYGTKEVKGEKSNPFILKIIKWIIPNADDDSTTAWCAIWAAWVLYKNGVLSNSDILKYGGKLASSRFLASILETTENPEIGDVVLLWRLGQNSHKGHIGFLYKAIDASQDYIYIYGGNQGDSVCDAAFLKTRIVSFHKAIKRADLV